MEERNRKMPEIIDRKPEGKKSGMTTPQMILSVVIFVVACVVIYMITHNPNEKKDMVVINVGGIDIIPGETKVADFLEDGFELAQDMKGSTIDETQKMKKDSYVSLIFLIKDQKEYGTISVGNDTGKEAPISQGTILSIRVGDSDEDGENVTADKIAMKDLSEEALIEAYGQPDSSEEAEYIGGTDLEWENKGYYFTANIGEDGKVQMLHSAYGHY